MHISNLFKYNKIKDFKIDEKNSFNPVQAAAN